MIGESKNGWTILGLVCANTFKYSGAVMQCVRQHVYLRFVPIDKLAVHPNFWCRSYWHDFLCVDELREYLIQIAF